MYAEVVLSKVTRHLDKIFHYKVPAKLEDKVQVGSQVLIPFGKRSAIGYVVGLIPKSTVKGIKEIASVTLEVPLFTEDQVKLAKWLSDYYCSFFATALKCVMPPGGQIRNPKPACRLASRSGQGRSEIRNKSEIPKPKPQLKLTDEQKKALDLVLSAIDSKKPETILLHGITGSGKTEVYMQAISCLLEKGKEAIVLVPEISLTPQMIERFQGRFGDQIAVLHSHMTLKQRRSEWKRIAEGEGRIVLGARSAIFAPVKNLGIIVIDEEYETTYKQDQSPRYHAREVAQYLSETYKIPLVLGSATPSLETFYKAKSGEYQLAVLPERIDNRPLPPVKIVDMRSEKKWLLSKALRDELRQTLSQGEQAILFMNRRGYFTFVMCHDCGFAISCPRCSVSLTYHTGERKLRCHRCDYSCQAPMVCPRCNSSSIRYFGTGTQRIEKEVADIYPAARILRWDFDAVKKHGSHQDFFSAFSEGKADVLIGTQMVTKGLDVANVTLVGVVSADTALHIPDFRAAEHTFQLLTQVAGRAGRHHLAGRVIVQTHSPEHYVIKTSAKHDYKEFYNQEIKHREELGYPPFSKLISLRIEGPELEKTGKIASDLEKFLKKRLLKGVLGPAPAVVPKVRGNFRFHILLKGQDLDEMRKAVVESLEKLVVPSEIRVVVDVEPMGMI